MGSEVDQEQAGVGQDGEPMAPRPCKCLFFLGSGGERHGRLETEAGVFA